MESWTNARPRPGDESQGCDGHDIVVVGMACSTAGANDVDAFWNMLQKGVSQHEEVPSSRFSMASQPRNIDDKQQWYGNFLKDHDAFDHRFFRMTAREAASTDPQQRLMLQTSYRALEHAGYFHSPEENVGCFMGTSAVDYFQNTSCHRPDAYSVTGTQTGFIAGKVSHYFGWTGPTMAIDTACSSSGVALHQACRALTYCDCSSALVGATFVMTSPLWYHNLDAAGFLSRTGNCKPFDAAADGYCRGEATAAVVICKAKHAVAQGRPILARIAGSALRQSCNEVPIVVPHVATLTSTFDEAIRKSGVCPEDISLVEAHGTGTQRGDLAEWTSLEQVLGKATRADTVVVGSAKGHVGHAEQASGLISLIKTVLAINHERFPPQAGFKHPAPFVRTNENLQVLMQGRTWQRDFRAALVSNYGATGACTAFVVTQAMGGRTAEPVVQLPTTTGPGKVPFWLTGESEESIRLHASRIRSWMDRGLEPINLASLSYNMALQSNRSLKFRHVFSAGTIDEFNFQLQQMNTQPSITAAQELHHSRPRPVILVFGGQGTSYIGLSHDVFESTALLRHHLESCNKTFKELAFGSIFPYIFQTTPIQDPVILQSCLFAMQYSTARTWVDCGASVVAAVGHSFGELVALCVCGKVSLRDMALTVGRRAQSIRDHWATEKGVMMAVQGNPQSVRRVLQAVSEALPEESLSIACFNGPTSFTVSGTAIAVDAFAKAAIDCKLRASRLDTTNAFHSSLVDHIRTNLIETLPAIEITTGHIHLEPSSQTNNGSTGQLPEYVADHLRSPVFFDRAVTTLAQEYPSAIWLEAGSNSGITRLAAQNLASASDPTTIPMSICKDGGLADLTQTTLRLWENGCPAQFWRHHRAQGPQMKYLFLPSYQFAGARHWMELKEHGYNEQGRQRSQNLWKLLEVKGQTAATFVIETVTDRLWQYISGHKVASQALIFPATAQISIVVEAVESLGRCEKDVRPCITDVLYSYPLCEQFLDGLRLTISKDDFGLDCWTWQLYGPSVDRVFSTGRVGFVPVTTSVRDVLYDAPTYDQCRSLLQDGTADDVLQGKGVYSAFIDVVEYGSHYRGLNKLVGGQLRSAGKVVKQMTLDEGSVDPIIADCFAQTAGIWVNTMTGRPSALLYLAKGIERWIPALASDIEVKEWHVYAVHRKSESLSSDVFSSDVYVFEPGEGRLVEAMLGIQYATTSKRAFQAMISRIEGEPPSHEDPTPQRSSRDDSHLQVEHSSTLVRLRAILVSLCGISEAEVLPETELAALGVDSLMAIELAKEIEVSYGIPTPLHKLLTLETVGDLCKELNSDGCTKHEPTTP